MTGRVNRSDVQIAVLSAVKIAGLLAWILVAPNTLQLLGARKTSAKTAQNATRRLIEKGYLERTNDGLRITKTGERYLDSVPPRPKKWDKKWRIVIFDIPERRKRLRDILRLKLAQIGFIKLQNSVWIYPYDCEELVVLLRRDYHLGKEVSFIVASRIEHDQLLRSRFGL